MTEEVTAVNLAQGSLMKEGEENLEQTLTGRRKDGTERMIESPHIEKGGGVEVEAGAPSERTCLTVQIQPRKSLSLLIKFLTIP